MSPAGNFLNLLMAAKPKQQAPKYNKVAKFPVMTVEVETVLLREPSGRPAKLERKYPYYPLLEKTVERVGGDSSSENGKGDGGAASSSAASSPAPKSTSSSSREWFSSGSPSA
jgi:hypothetical protein